MAMFNVKEFAKYVSERYKDKFEKTISPVRLQKTLYFCFAYWGGFVRKGMTQEENKEEIDVREYDEYLFDAQFQAWVYGPVIPEVYFANDIDLAYNENLFYGKDDVKEYIDELLDEINEVSDFRLVDISHKDNCWQEKFDYDAEHHNQIIDKESIISEYAKRKF